jgi:ABC-type transport system involved in Fe-S cluster assembly fused permease/ATPase subunit
MVVEFIFLSFSIKNFCGPLYLANFWLTILAYMKFTMNLGKERITPIKDKKNFEKKKDFYLHESISNYESIKAFNNEELEK